MIVGEGGCPPGYFLDRMTVAEASDYIEGMMGRYRPGWEQSRLVAEVNYKMVSGKDLGIRFPWERETAEEMTEEDLQRLIAAAKEIEKTL